MLVCCPLHCMLLSQIQGGRGFPGPDVTQADLCTVGGVGTMHVAPVMCGAMTGMAATLDSTFKSPRHSRTQPVLLVPQASHGIFWKPQKGVFSVGCSTVGGAVLPSWEDSGNFLPGAASEPQSRPENGEQILLATSSRAPSFLCAGGPPEALRLSRLI